MLSAILAGFFHAVARATFFDWLLLLCALLLALYVAGTWNYDYFTRRGVPYLPPRFPFLGNTGSAMIGLKSIPDTILEVYKQGEDNPVIGVFGFTKPAFMIKDPEVLKKIAVKEFDHFMNHTPTFNSPDNPVFNNSLFSLRDQSWRDMRATLSPTFTTSKLKGLFDLIDECGRQLVEHIVQRCEKERPGEALEVDSKQLFSRFTNDVIATTAFGVQCNSLREPDNSFYLMGRRFAQFRLWAVALLMMLPRLAQKMGVTFAERESGEYFMSLVKDTIKEREAKNIFRPDMLQLLMQAKRGELKGDDEEESNASKVKGRKMELSYDVIAAQACVFFFAGFDTVSTALHYCAYALATNPHVQERLRCEVEAALDLRRKELGGVARLSYEQVAALKYLDMVVSEVLRLFPPGSSLDRECVAPCTIEISGGRPPVHLKENDQIFIPVSGFHMDPQYWPNPEKFDPERFSEENKKNIKPFTYMPFGLGPRICIAQRFALLELKIALVNLVPHVEFLPAARSPVPIRYKRNGGLAFVPEGGFVVAVRPRTPVHNSTH